MMRAATGGHVQVMALLLTPEAEAERMPAVFEAAGVRKLWPALTPDDV